MRVNMPRRLTNRWFALREREVAMSVRCVLYVDENDLYESTVFTAAGYCFI